MDLQEVECGDMDWINLAQDRDSCQALVHAVMKLQVPCSILIIISTSSCFCHLYAVFLQLCIWRSNLLSQLMVHVMLFPITVILYFYISTFWSLYAVPNMTVLCSSLISCFPGMLLIYFLNYLEMVPVASITIGITSVFTVHVLLFFFL